MATQAQVGELEVGLLRTFLAVVDHGSMGKAATAADMTQPAVSQQMLRLERVIGHKLLARGRNGVTLTRHGEMLVTYANRALELNDEMLIRLRQQKPIGQVAVGAGPDGAMAGLIPGLTRLQTIRPELELKFVVTEAEKLDTMLRTGELDLAVTTPIAMRAAPSAIWRVPLQWAAGKSLQVERSRALPLVLFESRCPWRSGLLDSLRNAGWEWRITFESSSLDAILSATQSGLGVSALPIDIIRKSKLACLSDAGLPPAPTVEFGIFSGAVLSGPVRTVLEVVTAAIFH